MSETIASLGGYTKKTTLISGRGRARAISGVRMRFAARRDENEPAIVEALIERGYGVKRLNDPSLPDLIVAGNGVNVLVEVKTLHGRLTPAQEKWWSEPWPGPRFIARTAQEALEGMERYGNK